MSKPAVKKIASKKAAPQQKKENKSTLKTFATFLKKKIFSSDASEKETKKYVVFVAHTTDGDGNCWKVVNKKQLLELNPHDVVTAYEVGREVKVNVCID